MLCLEITCPGLFPHHDLSLQLWVLRPLYRLVEDWPQIRISDPKKVFRVKGGKELAGNRQEGAGRGFPGASELAL